MRQINRYWACSKLFPKTRCARDGVRQFRDVPPLRLRAGDTGGLYKSFTIFVLVPARTAFPIPSNRSRACAPRGPDSHGTRVSATRMARRIARHRYVQPRRCLSKTKPSRFRKRMSLNEKAGGPSSGPRGTGRRAKRTQQLSRVTAVRSSSWAHPGLHADACRAGRAKPASSAQQASQTGVTVAVEPALAPLCTYPLPKQRASKNFSFKYEKN